MRTTINYRGIIKMMGVLLVVIGVSLLLPLLVGVFYGEWNQVLVFGETIFASVLVGLIISRFYKPQKLATKERDGYVIVTMCWIVASLVGALPFYISGAIPKFVDAFFETCSGFSTTGASILTDVESLPKSMLMWRSFTHWLGGMGIIVLVTALLPSIGVGGQTVASAETPGPTMTKISARFSDMAKNLYKVYLVFTVVEIILLMLGGMNLYDSMIHSFGTVGTGGFSNYADSVGHFKSPYIQWVIIIFMILCGINFNLYFYVIKGRIADFFKDEELRFYLFIIAAFSCLITANLLIQDEYVNIEKAFRDGVFQVASIITTTGYATANYNIWPMFSKMLIFFVMITGACSSSTGGGVKLIRILAAIKFVKRGFFMKFHPNRVGDITVDGHGVQQSVMTNIVNFIFFFLVVLFGGSLLISVDGFDLVTNVSSALTCICNVGPGFNMVGPDGNFSIFSDFSTFVLAMMMVAGRLELFTFFIVLSPRYWNSNRP